MRRDYFSIDVHDLEWVAEGTAPTLPSLVIDFEGPASLLQERMTGGSAELLESSGIDVSFRFLTGVEDEDAAGVVSISDRVTGEFILEVNAQAKLILDFVKAAREYGTKTGEEDLYRIMIKIDGEEIVSYHKRTLLLYNEAGNLLRNHSLIPSGVEL